jgi:hypothetical protein
MPFAGYSNFAACVKANRDKKSPEAYCGSIMHAVEDKGVKPSYELNTRIKKYGDTASDGHIRINPKKGDVMNTILHEQLHNADWNMEHQKVYETAKKIESHMTLLEMATLLIKTHEAAMNPARKKQITHTVASKVITSKTN